MSPVSPSSFERRYRADGDPWDLAHSPYEQRRYALTMALLPSARYRSAFEPGCAVGELTVRLAARCDAVLAMDCAPWAVDRARRRCAGLPHVEIVRGEIPAQWPDVAFDLVMLSEIGYYFARVELPAVVAHAAAGLAPGGTLVAVHWRGHSDDHLLHGDEVHAIARHVAAQHRLPRVATYLEAAFRADVWTRPAP